MLFFYLPTITMVYRSRYIGVCIQAFALSNAPTALWPSNGAHTISITSASTPVNVRTHATAAPKPSRTLAACVAIRMYTWASSPTSATSAIKPSVSPLICVSTCAYTQANALMSVGIVGAASHIRPIWRCIASLTQKERGKVLGRLEGLIQGQQLERWRWCWRRTWILLGWAFLKWLGSLVDKKEGSARCSCLTIRPLLLPQVQPIRTSCHSWRSHPLPPLSQAQSISTWARMTQVLVFCCLVVAAVMRHFQHRVTLRSIRLYI